MSNWNLEQEEGSYKLEVDFEDSDQPYFFKRIFKPNPNAPVIQLGNIALVDFNNNFIFLENGSLDEDIKLEGIYTKLSKMIDEEATQKMKKWFSQIECG